MQLKELMKFIKKEDKRIKIRFGNYKDKEKLLLARTVKLTEELGELCDEVLSFNSMQRPEKLEKRNVDNLYGEFADVLMATLLLAEAMGVDVEKALKEKMKKLEERHKNILIKTGTK